MTCNEFLKAMQAEFGAVEFKATKGEQVIKSPGWVDQTHRIEVTPITASTVKGKK